MKKISNEQHEIAFRAARTVCAMTIALMAMQLMVFDKKLLALVIVQCSFVILGRISLIYFIMNEKCC